MASEYDRLRRLREKVESQETKLRKLRALRGQPDNANVNNNGSLTNDLESIRLLFNEKEKELAMAVTKVDELTGQLDELRSGKVNLNYPPQVVELEKLRRELAYRRQLNEQQNNMIAQQRAQLSMGQEEMARIDRRIAELQDRLTRKRSCAPSRRGSPTRTRPSRCPRWSPSSGPSCRPCPRRTITTTSARRISSRPPSTTRTTRRLLPTKTLIRNIKPFPTTLNLAT